MHKEGRTGNITSKEFIDEREICYENMEKSFNGFNVCSADDRNHSLRKE